MIVCPRCGKENQDHYKFCLGCGAELPRDAAHAPKSFSAPTPPAGFQGGGGGGAAAAPPSGFGPPPGPPPSAPGAFAPPVGGPPPMGAPPMGAPPMGAPPMGAPPMGAPPMVQPAASAPAGDTVVCPKCGNSNNRNFKFCGTCGHNLQEAAAPAPAPMPVAPPVQAAASTGARRGTLVLIRPDGSEGDSFPLSEQTMIGREAGGLFASDSYLSPRHASFQFAGPALTVTDQKSLNGVYMRIAPDAPTELQHNSIFRIGQEIIRFERLKSSDAPNGVEPMGSPNDGLVGRICLIIGRETTGNCYTIPAHGLHLGRERGDILFPDDGYVSGLHCRLQEEGGRMMLTDVGSSNGTFVRLTQATQVPSGSLLLMGQQLFRVEF